MPWEVLVVIWNEIFARTGEKDEGEGGIEQRNSETR
jgi:hypothetical protein